MSVVVPSSVRLPEVISRVLSRAFSIAGMGIRAFLWWGEKWREWREWRVGGRKERGSTRDPPQEGKQRFRAADKPVSRGGSTHHQPCRISVTRADANAEKKKGVGTFSPFCITSRPSLAHPRPALSIRIVAACGLTNDSLSGSASKYCPGVGESSPQIVCVLKSSRTNKTRSGLTMFTRHCCCRLLTIKVTPGVSAAMRRSEEPPPGIRRAAH